MFVYGIIRPKLDVLHKSASRSIHQVAEFACSVETEMISYKGGWCACPRVIAFRRLKCYSIKSFWQVNYLICLSFGLVLERVVSRGGGTVI